MGSAAAQPAPGAGAALDVGRLTPGARAPELDGLRALAALGVTLFHFGAAFPDDTAWGRAISLGLGAGWIGVDLFFALSGCLVTGMLLDARERPDLRAFWVERALRIVPPYYAVLAAWFLVLPRLVLAGRGHLELSDVVESFPWVGDLGEARGLWYWAFAANHAVLAGARVPLLAHAWSLSVEAQFYLLWPLTVWRLRPASLARLCAALAAAAPLLRAALLAGGVSGEAIYELTATRLDALALGSCVALAARHGSWRTRLQRLWRPVAAAAALAVGLLSATAGGLPLLAPPVQVAGYSLVGVGFAALVAGAVVAPAPGGTARSILGSRPMGALARLSYPLYLVHHPLCYAALALLATRWGALLASPRGYAAFMAAGVAVSLALAALVERWIGRPALALRQRLRTRRARARDGRAAAQTTWASTLGQG